MKHRLLTIILLVVLSLALFTPVQAQGNYYFAVERLVVHAYWNGDGTLSLDYTWVFVNQPGSHVIDFVDVGMPNYNFDPSQIRAKLDGTPLDVSASDYEGSGSGFAIVLRGQSIQPGQKGTVHVYVPNISGVLYNDTSGDEYASAVFAPTYFGSQYVKGATDYSVTFHLPPGVQPEEPRWHAAPSGFPSEPQTGFDELGSVTYTWYNPAGDVSNYYEFGASFPKTYVPAEAIYIPPPEPLFRIDPDMIFGLVCFGFFGFMFLGIPILTSIGAQRRKLQYLPPKVSIQGHGIKRGLTAVEASILMQQPLDKVMTMILFGALKKNAAEVVTRSPLKLKFAPEPPAELHQYEKDFLKAFTEEKPAGQRKQLQEMTVGLVRSVSDKMKGFSRQETIDYYKSIMERAWKQVEEADTPEVQSAKFDENLEWTMLDRDYDDRTRRTFRGPVYAPTWWGRYDPAYRPVSGSGGAQTVTPTVSGSGSRALPGADFAASVVGGVQNFSSKVIGNVNTFTEKITGVTNPPPKPTTSSYRGGGGGGRSCACACACAGCACACAGGGR
ncbi:MAG: hypothetical protein HFACDABA_02844 [Anaerolineales bacterium]|nr:hypothetical protein [Anaerolineales bacterium]